MTLKGTWSDQAQDLVIEDAIWRVTGVELLPVKKIARITLAAYRTAEHAEKAKAEAVPNTEVHPLGRQESGIVVLDEPDQMQTIHGRQEVAKAGTKDYTRFFGPDIWKKGGTNPIRQAYLAAKEHPLFKGAKDVLETEALAPAR